MSTTEEMITPPGLALCKACNYALRGLASRRCPECGRSFDPNDVRTMNLGRPLSAFDRWILGPVSWPTLIPFGALTAFVLWAAIDPSFYYIAWLAILVMYVMIVGTWLMLRGVLRFVVMRRKRQPPPLNIWEDRRGRWVLGTTFLMLMFIPLQIPLRIGFLMSKPRLDSIRARYEKDPELAEYGAGYPLSTRFIERAGLYKVIGASRVEGGLMLHVEDRFGGGEGGFAFLADGTLEGKYNEGSDGRLWGGWWWFAQD